MTHFTFNNAEGSQIRERERYYSSFRENVSY